MAFLDKIKNRWQKKEKEKQVVKKEAKKQDGQIKNKKDSPNKEGQKQSELKEAGKSVFASEILISPHSTEKTTALSEKGVYTFRVAPNANKPEIKKAVESLYNTKVQGVRILKTPSKKRKTRGIVGIKPGFKRALVALKKGEKIEFI